MHLKKTSLKRLLILALLGFTLNSLAQIRIHSPYSIFGVGKLRSDSYNTVLMSMGGIRNAASGEGLVNMYNPATYIAFDSTSFVFDGGILATSRTLKSVNASETGTYASLNHLLFGFPVTRWLKSSFGVVPYSDVGYNVVDDLYLKNIGNTKIQYIGSGGLNQAYIGAAFRLHKNWSLGVNMYYNFGTIDKSRNVLFPDSVDTYLNAKLRGNVRISDLSYSLGLLFKKELQNRQVVSAGITFTPEARLRSKIEYLASTFIGGLNNPEYLADTIVNTTEEKGKTILPTQIGGGLMIEAPRHWKVGIDFNWQEWSSYRSFGISDSLANSWNVSIGGEYIPDHEAIKGYLKKIRYRLGFRYSQTNIYLKGNHMNEIGISFGFGLPIVRSKSTFNLGFEFGKFGTTNDGLIRENFVKFTLGLSIYENWFIRSKYK